MCIFVHKIMLHVYIYQNIMFNIFLSVWNNIDIYESKICCEN